MMPTRRNAAFGLALAGAAALPATRVLAQAAPGPVMPQPATPEPGKLEEPDEDSPPTRLPTRESRNDHMLAPVSINGQGPFNFLLDTGANISCVSNKLMARLSLTAASSLPVHTMVGVRDRPVVTLQQLQVGPRSRRNVRTPALPINEAEVDGILGVDWLRGQRLVLDFKGQRLEITRSQRDNNEPGRVVVVPARRRKGQLTIVDADLSGTRISAIIDSGAQTTLCNTSLRNLALAQEEKRGSRLPPRYVRMETLAGESFQGEAIFLPFMRLGGLHLGNVPVTCCDMHVFDIWDLKDSPALVLGMDLLQQFEKVALDFGRSQVRFEFV